MDHEQAQPEKPAREAITVTLSPEQLDALDRLHKFTMERHPLYRMMKQMTDNIMEGESEENKKAVQNRWDNTMKKRELDYQASVDSLIRAADKVTIMSPASLDEMKPGVYSPMGSHL